MRWCDETKSFHKAYHLVPDTIIGPDSWLRHSPSSQCLRNQNPTFPLILAGFGYSATRHKRYKRQKLPLSLLTNLTFPPGDSSFSHAEAIRGMEA
jgi:hypothetical protein